MTRRATRLAPLLALTCLAPACGDDDARPATETDGASEVSDAADDARDDTSTAATDTATHATTDAIDARPFRMGFQPWPYAITQAAVDWTWDRITRDGDLYSIHIEEGVPWPELLADAPFPAAFEASLAAKQAAIAPDHAVLLSLNALDVDRAGLAKYRGANVNEPLPAPWDAADFDDDDVKVAYTRYCRRMIDRFDPDWVVIGIEVNLLVRQNPGRWPAWLALFRHVRDDLAAAYPGLPIGASVFANAYVDGFRDDADVPAAHDAALAELRPELDFLGLSAYPFMSGHLCNDFGDAYAPAIFALGAGLPVAVTESGYPAERWALTVGDVELVWDCTEAAQANALARLLAGAEAARSPFYVWFTVRDYDALWEAIGRDPVALVWRDTGLFDADGRERAALATWRAQLARPHATP